ncbi:hypothetical protein LY76DRAFT_543266 [Colletotrichum caudatum]|nr:hypothetical protein LY76DRAFT_543266 [Colletotrichum caudatum]
MDPSPPEEGSPAAAVLRRMADIEAAFRRARQLRKRYNALKRKAEPRVEPNEERPQTDPETKLRLANLGIALASQEKEVIRTGQKLAIHRMHKGDLAYSKAMGYIRRQDKCYFSAGGDLWRHKKEKAHYDYYGTAGLPASYLRLYTRSDGLEMPRRQPSAFRKDAVDYYNGSGGNGRVWCHASGMWHLDKDIKAAHIVPFFADMDCIPAMVFGCRAESIRRPGNALLLVDQIKRWFDGYCIVIVPVDAAESPIRRWRTDVLCPGIKALQYRRRGSVTDDLDGRELAFVNDKRPAPRFLYFRFIVALVRMKRLGRIGWQEVWAKYHGRRPFPSPEAYIRKGVLLAIASHFDASDAYLVNSWIHEHGVDTFLQLNDDEAVEVARRVHMAVEFSTSRAKKGEDEGEDDEEDEGDDGEEDDGEDPDEDDEDSDEDDEDSDESDEDDEDDYDDQDDEDRVSCY